MKKIVIPAALILIPFMFINVTFADSDHHNDSKNMTSTMDMSKMNTNMDKMQSLMKEAHETKSLKKRQELMQSHMKEMMSSMEMMDGMTMGKEDGHEKNGKHMKDSNDVAMKKRQDLMEQNMMMIQEMMMHMMDQQAMMGQSMMMDK